MRRVYCVEEGDYGFKAVGPDNNYAWLCDDHASAIWPSMRQGSRLVVSDEYIDGAIFIERTEKRDFTYVNEVLYEIDATVHKELRDNNLESFWIKHEEPE